MKENKKETYNHNGLIDSFLEGRWEYVPLSCGRIFQEEKRKIKLNSDVRLALALIPYDSKGKLFSKKKVNAGNSQVITIARDKSRIVQIEGKYFSSPEEFRKLCRHELYHIKAGHIDVVDIMREYIPFSFEAIRTVFNFVADIQAEKYANKK